MWFLHHNVWQFLSCVVSQRGNAKEGESGALTRQGRKEEGASFSLRLLCPW